MYPAWRALGRTFPRCRFCGYKGYKKTRVFGNWRGKSTTVRGEYSRRDPEKRALYLATQTIPGAMEKFSDWFPDEEMRNDFGRKVVKELEENSLHICSKTYAFRA